MDKPLVYAEADEEAKVISVLVKNEIVATLYQDAPCCLPANKIMTHFQASLKRNDLLGKLLAQ